LDFSVTTEYDLDAQNIQSLGWIQYVQTVFIDNSANADALVLTVDPNGSAQQIIAGPNSQGYYNALCPNPVKMSFVTAGGVVVPIYLTDVAIPGAVWSTV
jgi:hypothetical protein